MPATDEDYATEYLAMEISAKVVDSLDDAIDHIRRFSSHHTEAIVTRDLAAAQRFAASVDAAAVMGIEAILKKELTIRSLQEHHGGPER